MESKLIWIKRIGIVVLCFLAIWVTQPGAPGRLQPFHYVKTGDTAILRQIAPTIVRLKKDSGELVVSKAPTQIAINWCSYRRLGSFIIWL